MNIKKGSDTFTYFARVSLVLILFSQSAGAVESTDYISAEG